MSSRRLFASFGDREVVIEVDLAGWPAVRAVVSGRDLSVDMTEIGAGMYWFTLAGRSVEVRVSRDGGLYRVDIGADSFSFRLADRPRARSRTVADSDRASEIRAPMPGRVVDLLVGVGARVEPGQGLLVLEAMKMQNEIRSPRHGVVGHLSVRAGQAVNAGDLLARVESGS